MWSCPPGHPIKIQRVVINYPCRDWWPPIINHIEIRLTPHFLDILFSLPRFYSFLSRGCFHGFLDSPFPIFIEFSFFLRLTNLPNPTRGTNIAKGPVFRVVTPRMWFCVVFIRWIVLDGCLIHQLLHFLLHFLILLFSPWFVTGVRLLYNLWDCVECCDDLFMWRFLGLICFRDYWYRCWLYITNYFVLFGRFAVCKLETLASIFYLWWNCSSFWAENFLYLRVD